MDRTWRKSCCVKGHSVTIIELAQVVKRMTNSPSEIRYVPYDEAYRDAGGSALPPWPLVYQTTSGRCPSG